MPNIADIHGALRNIVDATEDLDAYIARMESGAGVENEFWLADDGYLYEVDERLFSMLMYAFYLLMARIELGEALGED